jgi:DNA-binding MarR family transcriptional regulator
MDTAAEFVKIWMRLTKDWSAALEEELAPQLTAGQLEVLELLQEKEPMKPSDLLPYLETTPAAVTTLLDRMERAGLVERKRDEHDRRIVWIHMTELGRSEAERGLRVRSGVAARSLERISAHNRQLLVYLMGKVAGSRDKSQAESGQASPSAETGDQPQDAGAEQSAEPAEDNREKGA